MRRRWSPGPRSSPMAVSRTSAASRKRPVAPSALARLAMVSVAQSRTSSAREILADSWSWRAASSCIPYMPQVQPRESRAARASQAGQGSWRRRRESASTQAW